jgi:hypothetical protein
MKKFLFGLLLVFVSLQGGSQLPFMAQGQGETVRIAMYRSASGQTADGTTYVAIQWDNEILEDNTFSHDNVTNNTRITVSKTRRYLVMGVINYYGTTSNYRLTTRVTYALNGGDPEDIDIYFDGSYLRNSSGSRNTGCHFNFVVEMTANDYIEIFSKRISTTAGDGVTTDGTNITLIEL